MSALQQSDEQDMGSNGGESSGASLARELRSISEIQNGGIDAITREDPAAAETYASALKSALDQELQKHPDDSKLASERASRDWNAQGAARNLVDAEIFDRMAVGADLGEGGRGESGAEAYS